MVLNAGIVHPAFSGETPVLAGPHGISDPVGSNAIGTVLDYCADAFQLWAGYEWAAVAKEDAIVRGRFPHDPKETIFQSTNDLPALCCWCHDIDHSRYSAGFAKRSMWLKIAWIPSPGSPLKDGDKDNLFILLDTIMTNVVLNDVSIEQSGTVTGQSLKDKANLFSLGFVAKTQQQEAQFENGVTVHRFPLYVWNVLATDLTGVDFAAAYRQAHALQDGEIAVSGGAAGNFPGENGGLRLNVNRAGHPAFIELRDPKS